MIRQRDGRKLTDFETTVKFSAKRRIRWPTMCGSAEIFSSNWNKGLIKIIENKIANL